ncbi:sensor histidine kinase N-terminal domain-containing protein [Tateyamaria sp. SN6-1]|uniref:sensor histidine kinase n=1 Tax=Tateyamaria sp. SN6-1 TaxID=3092148 RepID=UPI0039F4D30C
MTPTQSIGRRLTLLLAAISALLAILSWSMVSIIARQAAERTQDNILAASATTIAETLRSEGGEVRLDLPYAAFAMLGAVSQDRVFYRVDAAGEVLTGYADLPLGGAQPTPGQIAFDTVTYLDANLRMASITRRVLAGPEPVPVTVSVAQTRNGIGRISGELSRTAAALSVAFFVLAVVLTAVAARASLRPLNEIAEAVARRGPSDLRPIKRAAPAELVPLISSLNRLIDRLAQSLRRSEDFIAEAAHRVRTPLATVRAQAEVALHSAQGSDEKHRLRQMIRAVDESSRSAGQLLDHATVAYRAEDLARDRIDFAGVAHTVADALRPTAGMKEIDIRVDAATAWVKGDEVLLENALRNVLDNAIKYSPDETVVTMTLTTQGDTATLQVCDEGPGLGAGPVDKLTERFQRGSNVAGIVGSGLGLTIAHDVLSAHGGRLDLEPNAQKGGACVSLVLPLA